MESYERDTREDPTVGMAGKEEGKWWPGEDVSRIHIEELGIANSNQKAGVVVCSNLIDDEKG